MGPEEALDRLRALGFDESDAQTLFDHFDDAERRGKAGHGYSRIEWLETLELDPDAKPEKVASFPGFEHWDGNGALGYLTLAAICASLEDHPPRPARVVTAANCFPTGTLGYWVRWLAEAGLVALLTATSPPRLAHPDGGPPVVGTNPLAIGIPTTAGRPKRRKGLFRLACERRVAGEVVAERGVSRQLGEPLAHLRCGLGVALGAVVLGRPPHPRPRNVVRRRLERGARLAAHRENRRPRLLRDRAASRARLADVDDRSRRRVDLVAVDREGRMPGEHDVQLLGVAPVLGVRTDDLVARLRADE